MSNLFQKIKTGVRPAEKFVAPQLTLAAFGKHPGWDDHIPGIGVVTDALAYAKQSLYVSGIGKQIDSGAWEKLEPEKRLEGFDHTFLWIRPGHLLLGELWSSTDGKGRAKYPMVLCVDSEGVAPVFLLAKVQPDLERLRVTCKAAATSAQVETHCQTSQEQMRKYVSQADPGVTANGLNLDARRKFLENREFMPDRLGLMRVLHELGETSSRSRHLRVPLASESHTEALLLWSEFFKLVVPATVAVFLVSHRGADWLDVLIGEPEGADFFCLQAALKAVPLTTEIPYELAPETKPRWNELEARFLGLVAPTKNEPSRVASAPSADNAETNEPPATASGGERKWLRPVLAGAVLLLALFGYLLFKGSANTKARSPEPVPTVTPKPEVEAVKPVIETVRPVVETKPVTNPVSPAPSKPATVTPVAPPPPDQYDAAMTAARAALEKRNFSEAIARAEAALLLKPGDPAAASLKRDTSMRQQEQAAQTQRQKQFTQAVEAGQAAFDKNDFTTALAQADLALSFKTNDPVADKLRDAAKSQMNRVALATADRQNKYDSAMKAAGAALLARNFDEAIRQADTALMNVTGDAGALKLKDDALKALADMAAQAEREKHYQAAMTVGQKAYEAKDYAGAGKQAETALANKPADAAAAKLKTDAEARQAEIAAQAERDNNYQSAMAAAQSAYSRKDFSEAIKNADVAQLNKFGDAEAAGLKKKAAEGKDLLEVQACIESGDLDKARSLCVAHAGTPAFDELARKIVENTSDKLDDELELYRVWFGQLEPANAKSSKAREAKKMPPGDLGFGPKSQREVYLKLVEKLRAGFKNSGRLDKEHLKNLDELKQAINER